MLDWTTWSLVRQWVRSQTKVEALSRRRWKRWPLKYLRENFHRRRCAREDGIVDTLSDRYRVVLQEIFCEVHRRVPEASAAAFHGEAWVTVRAGLPGVTAEQAFSTVLWRGIESIVQTLGVSAGVRGVQRFKAKVMLRQFVDEMPNCEERGTLRLAVYDSRPITAGGEALALLDRAYVRLHPVVVRHAENVAELTDAVVLPEILTGLDNDDDVIAQYDHWLNVQ